MEHRLCRGGMSCVGFKWLEASRRTRLKESTQGVGGHSCMHAYASGDGSTEDKDQFTHIALCGG